MARSIDEIVNSLSEPDRILAAEKMAELDRKLEQRRQFDAAIVDSLLRILKSPLGKTLRDKIKEIAAVGIGKTRPGDPSGRRVWRVNVTRKRDLGI